MSYFTPLLPMPQKWPASLSAEQLQWLATVRRQVILHLHRVDFGNKELATLLFISDRTLARRLLRYTGLTTNKYLLTIRLEEARRLLDAKPAITTPQLTLAVGFQKSSYFAARFREHFGVSPHDYARGNK